MPVIQNSAANFRWRNGNFKCRNVRHRSWNAVEVEAEFNQWPLIRSSYLGFWEPLWLYCWWLIRLNSMLLICKSICAADTLSRHFLTLSRTDICVILHKHRKW